MDLEAESETCPVCFNELGKKDIFITKCGHTFCGTCFVTNLSYTLKCPLCREYIVDVSNVNTPSPANIPTPPIPYSDVPNRADLITIYGDLIVGYFREQTDGDREYVRTEIINLLRAFEMDARLIVSPLENRPLSVSDIQYNPDNYGGDLDDGSESDEVVVENRNRTEN